MAYLKPITRKCSSCDRPATVELLNRFNARMAEYCQSCGKRALARLKAEEDRQALVPQP